MWTYLGREITSDDLEGFAGFVYQITNTISGKAYIGKKVAKFSKTKKIKGSTRKKHFKVESDWKTYWGSSDALLDDIKTLGEDKFRREILYFCKSKAELAYVEAREQFKYDVLLWPEKWYNGHIMVRVHGSTLKGMHH